MKIYSTKAQSPLAHEKTLRVSIICLFESDWIYKRLVTSRYQGIKGLKVVIPVSISIKKILKVTSLNIEPVILMKFFEILYQHRYHM